MAELLRTEEECAEKAIVNRNVELLSWYIMLKGLREMASTPNLIRPGVDIDLNFFFFIEKLYYMHSIKQ